MNKLLVSAESEAKTKESVQPWRFIRRVDEARVEAAIKKLLRRSLSPAELVALDVGWHHQGLKSPDDTYTFRVPRHSEDHDPAPFVTVSALAADGYSRSDAEAGRMLSLVEIALVGFEGSSDPVFVLD